MTPSEIAEECITLSRLEAGWYANVGKRTGERCCEAMRNAAATIRAQAEEVRALSDCRCELEAVSLALGSGVRFMDPPDGGSVTIAEQVVRMRIALHEAETKLKIATEALEGIAKGNRGQFESGDHMAFDKLMCAAQALARIKEV